MIAATCNPVPDSRTTRGSAWLAIAIVDGVTYSATSRSSAVGALCRELVAGGVPDGSMTVTFDNIAGVMTIASIYRFAGTTTGEGDVPIRRAKWNPYRGPQNAEPAAPAETGIRESQSPVLWEPSLRERAAIAAELSVTAICAGCGAGFIPKRSDARFCSGRCRVARIGRRRHDRPSNHLLFTRRTARRWLWGGYGTGLRHLAELRLRVSGKKEEPAAHEGSVESRTATARLKGGRRPRGI